MAPSPAAPNGTTIVARSALLTLTATPADDSLALKVTRLANHQPVTGPGNVRARLDGRSVPLTAQAGGAYLLPLRGVDAGSHSLRVVVAHDGIRELLTGNVSVPRHTGLLDSLEGHGMSAWWVLNIAVVLIAVLVISRRRR